MLLPQGEVELDVIAEELVAEDVRTLTLAHPDGGSLPAWTPGAHIDLVLDNDLVRQYSLCGRPEDDTWRIAVLRTADSRGGSERVHRIEVNERVRVRGPRNNFPLAAARSYVFVAGGIGITPILPMVRQADAAGVEWELHYGGRTRRSMAFVDELGAYGDRVHLVPEDEHGPLDLDGILGTPRPGTLVYACGPAAMLEGVEVRCRSWLPKSLHLERFSADPAASDGENEAFDVVLKQSGMTLEVPADRSILEVVREAGLSVLSSCLEGNCGTCETEVLDGGIDHRDSVLSDEERASGEIMMICVSRCHSGRLTLDL